MLLSVLQGRFRWHGLESFQVRPVPNHKDVVWTKPASGNCEFLVAQVRCHDDVTEAVREPLQGHLAPIKKVFPSVLRDVQLGVGVVMIKDVLDTQELERQRDEENIVRRVTTLNDLKSVPQVDPPTEQDFPKQRAGEFNQIAQGTIPLRRRRMTVNMNAVKDFVRLHVAFAL